MGHHAFDFGAFRRGAEVSNGRSPGARSHLGEVRATREQCGARAHFPGVAMTRLRFLLVSFFSAVAASFGFRRPLFPECQTRGGQNWIRDGGEHRCEGDHFVFYCIDLPAGCCHPHRFVTAAQFADGRFLAYDSLENNWVLLAT